MTRETSKKAVTRGSAPFGETPGSSAVLRIGAGPAQWNRGTRVPVDRAAASNSSVLSATHTEGQETPRRELGAAITSMEAGSLTLGGSAVDVCGSVWGFEARLSYFCFTVWKRQHRQGGLWRLIQVLLTVPVLL